MPQETVVLVSNLSDKFLTAQDDINNNFNELYASAPPSLTGNALKFLRVNAGETAVEWATGGGGVTAFTGLSDVPSSYSGQALKVVRVNAAPNAKPIWNLENSLLAHLYLLFTKNY